MNRFQVILWDIDGTLLDFSAAQAAAIRQCFARFSLGECTDEMLTEYDRINTRYWQALERGEIDKKTVLEGRFREFFGKYGLSGEIVPVFNAEYQYRLGDTIVFCRHAPEAVRSCRELGVRQFAVTNGTKAAQERKMRNSGLEDLLDGVFISDEIGFEKPNPAFFAPVFAAVGDSVGKEEILIVGDSLTSDMQGGVNAGIRTCWYRRPGQEITPALPLDFIVEDLMEVPELVRGRAPED